MTIDDFLDQTHNNTIFTTQDGSHSLFSNTGEAYHSRHGAIQESAHVFIKMGLDHMAARSPVKVLELGFGTGLNAFMSYLWASDSERAVEYSSLETSPIDISSAKQLNYPLLLNAIDQTSTYLQMHLCDWEKSIPFGDFFSLEKVKLQAQEFDSSEQYDCIFFDAFAPSAQPELWTKAIFEKMFALCAKGGCLVTYCAKGQVRRNMQSAGFVCERLPGPPGKREMLRAWGLG